MNDLECLRLCRERYHDYLIAAGIRYSVRVEVLAGIMMRETRIGTSHLLDKPGPEGRGDGGHGHGLMQIDDRSFPEFCASPDWADPQKNIYFAAGVLAGKRQYLTARVPWLTPTELERAAIAAYNCGEGRVRQALHEGRDPDSDTTGGDFSRAVLEYAVIYKSLQIEETKPTWTSPSISPSRKSWTEWWKGLWVGSRH